MISVSDADEYAKKLKIDHYSASARTGKNVNTIFKALTERKSRSDLTEYRRGDIEAGEQGQQTAASSRQRHAQREGHRHRGRRGRTRRRGAKAKRVFRQAKKEEVLLTNETFSDN
jgi:hypothetical protein